MGMGLVEVYDILADPAIGIPTGQTPDDVDITESNGIPGPAL